jgi:N-methylhydantoinase A
LYIRDEHRYDMFDPQIEYGAPLVPREHTFGVAERVLADGRVHASVDQDQLASLAAALVGAGVQSVAVCLLNAYVNGANEQAVGAALARHAPDLYVSLSSEVAPQIREYPRAATTVINAYTRPITAPYLDRLTRALADRGFPGAPLIMMSNGGVLGTEMASRFPVRMVESGPAAGALVASHFAERLGLDRLMSFDMGGTTAKACLIEDRKPTVTGLFEVDRMYRFKAGSGMPVIIPAIDMIEIGAGGGSIASVDALGLLKVGPESAGSEPGPACYGRGGTAATVTDADLVLGVLDAGNFLGGDMALDIAAAERAVAAIAEKLGVGLAEAARGIFEVVGESMAAAARAHATDRGLDHRGLPVLAFGGAGPAHACYVAELLDGETVIYPPLASVLSAFGTLITPLRYDLARGVAGAIDWDRAETVIAAMTTEARGALIEAGCPAEGVRFSFGGDLRYAGQQNEVTVEFTADPAAARDEAALRSAFEATYEATYDLRLPDVAIEVVAWRVSGHGPAVERDSISPVAALPGSPKGTRPVDLGGNLDPVTVYDRTALSVGQTMSGPVIIEERETTIFVMAGWRASVGEDGCITATRKVR